MFFLISHASWKAGTHSGTTAVLDNSDSQRQDRQMDKKRKLVHAVKWALQKQIPGLWRFTRGVGTGGVLLLERRFRQGSSAQVEKCYSVPLASAVSFRIPIHAISRWCLHESVGHVSHFSSVKYWLDFDDICFIPFLCSLYPYTTASFYTIVSKI